MHTYYLLFFLLLQGTAISTASPNLEDYVSFSGYQVIRATARTEAQGYSLVGLERIIPSVDFWKDPSIDDDTDIMIAPEYVDQVKSYLSQNGVKHFVLMEDVGRMIERQRVKVIRQQATADPISWTQYNTLDTIYEWYNNLTSTYSIVEQIDIGNSTEGRPIKVLYMTKNPGLQKPAIFIDSGIHAREWISVASVTYMVNQLIGNLQDNLLLNDVDFYFLPVINVDGYEYTFTTNRMWRKTRSYHGNDCYGVDPNRNFDFMWNSCGSQCSSGVCSSQTFRGPSAFSEPETEAMRKFITERKANGTNFIAYISVHSYGQYFMQPWGYTSVPTQDHEELQMLGDYVAGNITALFGTQYRTGPSSTTIYPTDGSSQDWAYGSGLFKYSYTAELRDTGSYGFILPPEQIIPTAVETWNGFKVVARHIIGQ